VQFPNTGQPKKIMRKVPIPRANFLIAKIAVLDLLSHPLLHQRKGTEQNNRNDECDFI
jgi:hypothetical protein